MGFKKGNVINLGRTLTIETKKKMSIAHQSCKPSEWGAGFKKGNIPWNKGLERKAYFAGLVDGEGSINITGKKYKNACIAIAMRATCSQPLDEAKEFWGGYLYNRPAYKQSRAAREWRIQGSYLDKFLQDILPFLRIKKEQAKTVIEFRNLMTRKRKGTNKISEEEVLYRERLINNLKKMHE